MLTYETKWRNACNARQQSTEARYESEDVTKRQVLVALAMFLEHYAASFNGFIDSLPEAYSYEEKVFFNKLYDELKNFRDYLDKEILVEMSKWNAEIWEGTITVLEKVRNSNLLKSAWVVCMRLKPIINEQNIRDRLATDSDYDSYETMRSNISKYVRELRACAQEIRLA